MSVLQDQHLVESNQMFPFRPADTAAACGPQRPFGASLAALAVTVQGRGVGSDVEVELGYSHATQVATINGCPAVTSAYGKVLVAKKGNTVHDTQTDTEELAS